MKKINRRFISFYHYLELLSKLKFNPVGQHTKTVAQFSKEQIFGSLEPLNEILHDTEYTFKAYHSIYDLLRDFIQPLRGLKNVIWGLVNIVAALLFFLIKACTYPLSKDGYNNYFDYLKGNLLLSISWLINGLGLFLRGASQIISTPLTWFLRVPLRGSLHASFGAPKIEENEEIEYLHQLCVETTESEELDLNLHDLHNEYLNCLAEYQETDIREKTEQTCFHAIYKQHSTTDRTTINKHAAKTYLKLFEKRPAVIEENRQVIGIPDALNVKTRFHKHADSHLSQKMDSH